MLFQRMAVTDAEGTVLAHGLKVGSAKFRKGRLLTADDVDALLRHGVVEVTGARLEPGDVAEDEAATRVAMRLAGPALTRAAAYTGRVNLFAAAAGLFTVDRARLDDLNRLDESITVATLPDLALVAPRDMVATIKIIPFAAPATALDAVDCLAPLAAPPILAVRPFRPLRTALIQTRLEDTKAGMLTKTTSVTRERLSSLGATLDHEAVTDHAVPALARGIAGIDPGVVDLILLVGASAITDRRDVLPAAIEAAGGTVEHFGMPVDPGNLLLLAHLHDRPILGLPGCARSPKLNGVDWVLRRLAAGVPVRRDDIAGMGVGGLLADIPNRPLPRTETGRARATNGPQAPRVAAVILAAGRSTRMGPQNKLLLPFQGKPLVLHTVDAALASQVDSVIVVLGHEADRVRAALGDRTGGDRPVELVPNPLFTDGLSASLRAGVAVLPDRVDAALVCLGDMPNVTAETLDRLIAAYAPAEGRAICVPTVDGKRGNPVLWDRRFFADMGNLAGDVGAKHLIGLNNDVVAEVAMAGSGTLTDIDTPADLADARDS